MIRPSPPAGFFAADGLTDRAARTTATLAAACGALTLVLGIGGTIGWLLDIRILRHLVEGAPAVKPLTAVCLGLLGGSLWLSSSRPRGSIVLALLAIAAASLPMFQALDAAEASAHRFLVHPALLADPAADVAERLRSVDLLAASGLVTLAVALLTTRVPRLVITAQALAIAVLFMALVPLLAFVYRIGSPITPLLPSPPALIGSTGIALLAIGALCANPERGAVALLSSDTTAGRAARRLLLPALVVPMLLGGALAYARQHHALDIDSAVPIFVCGLAAALGAVVLLTARSSARLEILQRRGEEALRSAVDTTPLMMWIADTVGRTTHLNPATLEFLGTTQEAVAETGYASFVHPDDLDVVTREVFAALSEERPYSAEFRVRHSDGSWRWIISTGMPRYTATNEVLGYTGSWVDVTARKDSEYALRQFADELEERVAARTEALSRSTDELTRQTALLESVVQSMGDAVLAVAMDGRILLSNDAALNLFGASAVDAQVNALTPEYGFFLEDGATPFPLEDLPLMRALHGESTDNVMMVVKHHQAPDGLSVRVTGRPLRDRDGTTLGSIVVGRDVTEFEKAAEAGRRLATVVEASSDAIMSVALDGRILSWNRGAELLYGYAAVEAIGVPFGRLDPSLDARGIARMINERPERQDGLRRELRVRCRDGSLVDILATISPILGEDGEVAAWSVIHHDVSHLKAAERRIQALNDELEERVRDRTAALVAANHDLENYAFSVAHDLRTPLRAIAGFARVLEEDYASVVDDEGRRVIGVVRKNAQDMGAFIDALLSFSAVDRQPPRKERVDVADVVRECVDSMGPDCAERDIAFHLGHLPPCRADPALLKQVFLNLLANAVKFTRRTEKAHIEIGSMAEPGGSVAYFVRDNGVGFDMSNTRRLFGIFQRLHAPGEFEGSGLGLASVARIVAAHGGRVWAESEPGKGARFFFIIDPRESAS